MKKLVIVGATGTIGKKLADSFSKEYEIIAVARTTKPHQMDMTSESSIRKFFHLIGQVDGLICVAGEAKWKPLQELTNEDFANAIASKLMGQINLVRTAVNYLHPTGSITLTSGILGDKPLLQTTAAATVNGGINSFVKAAALDIQPIRINVVSSGVVEDTYEKYKSYFKETLPVLMKELVNAYKLSLEGDMSGKIIRIDANNVMSRSC